jgi:hypothetical protein
MANNYTDILALANKNNMGLSNTIKRDYGIPLDYSSVQETYEAALSYAQNSTLAYIGQPISVGDTLYIVTGETGDAALKEVGSKPVGDNVSISVSDEGVISLFGFEAAATATLPRKNTDGSISWITLADIAGAVDTNTKVVIKAADDSDITVTPVYDDTTDTYTYTLDVQLPAIPEYAIKKEAGEGVVNYTLTKDGEAVAETIVVPNAYDDTALAGRVDAIEAAYATEADLTLAEGRLDIIEGEGDGSIQKAATDTLASAKSYTDTALDGLALEIISATADAPIKLVIKNSAGDVIAETDATDFIKDGMLKDVSFDATTNELVFNWNTEAGITEDRVDIANFVDTYTANESSGLKLDDNNEFSIDTTIIATKASVDGLTTALGAETTARENAITALGTDIETAKTAAVAAAKTETETQVGALKTELEGQIDAVDAKFAGYYNKTEIDSKVEALNQGASDAAANLATEVEALEAADTALNEKITELNNTIAALDDTYATDVAVAKIVEDADKKYETAANVATYKQNLENSIAAETEARTQAVSELDAAYKAADALIEGKINTINDNITTHAGKIATNEAAIATNTATIAAEQAARETLAGTVATNSADIVNLRAKDTELAGAIQANTDKFANYSNTTEMNNAISASAQTLQTNIDAANQAIDAVEADVEDHETRIAALESDNTTNKADIAQAKTDIAANATEIARVDAALRLAIDDNDEGKGLESIKDLATWIEDHGDEAAGMVDSITANTNAITILNSDSQTAGSVDKKIADAIAAIPATPIATTSTAGLVKASEEISVATDGAMSIAQVSTDVLVNGQNVLILDGGTALN